MITKEVIAILSKRAVVSIGELATSLNHDRRKIRKILHYLYKKGIVRRVLKGYYTVRIDPFVVATNIYTPSYLTGISSLVAHGVSEQIPNYHIIVVPPKVKPKTLAIGGETFRLLTIPKKFFFGYYCRESPYDEGFYYFIAKPEKAILDMVYLRIPINPLTLHIDRLDLTTLFSYLRKYPYWVEDSIIGELGRKLSRI